MQRQKSMRIFWVIFDFLIVPLLIIFLMHEPNFATGHVDHLEASWYLPNIDAVLNGKVPYRDFFVLHGPLQLYFQAFFFYFFGSTIYNLFLFFYSTAILNYLIVYFLLRQVLKIRIFILFTFFVALVETYHPFWAARWGYFRIGFSLMAILMIAKFLSKNNKKYILWGGIFSALSLFYSVDTGVFIILAVLLYLLFYSIYFDKTNIVSQIIRNLGMYVSGILLILVPFLLYFYFNKALYDYAYTSFYIMPRYFLDLWAQKPKFFIHPISYYANLFSFLKSQSFKLYLPLYIYIFIFIYFSCLYIRRKEITREKSILILLSIYGSLLYKASFRATESSQFQLAILPCLLIGGILLEKVYFAIRFNIEAWNKYRKYIFSAKAIGYFLVIILAITYFIYSDKRYYGDITGWWNYQIYRREYIPSYMSPFPKQLAKLRYCREPRVGKMIILNKEADDFEDVTCFIRSNTAPNEIVFSFPEYGVYNFLAQRPCLSRFYVTGIAYTFPKWRAELLEEIKRVRPKYIIYGRGLSNLAASIESKQELLPEVRDYINKHYQIIRQFKTVDIYQRIHAKSH